MAGETWTVEYGSRPMLCPVCRFDNFEGEDTCANCGADLAAADVPQPAIEFHDTILGSHLDALGVGEPSVVEAGHHASPTRCAGCTRPGPTACWCATATGWSGSSPTATPW